MQINITHSKNPLIGWDIDIKLQADAGQQIADVDIKINEMPEEPESLEDNLTSWEAHLPQKRIYPGANRVVVTVTDQNGDTSRAEQRWS